MLAELDLSANFQTFWNSLGSNIQVVTQLCGMVLAVMIAFAIVQLVWEKRKRGGSGGGGGAGGAGNKTLAALLILGVILAAPDAILGKLILNIFDGVINGMVSVANGISG